jgi:hypothetical protein
MTDNILLNWATLALSLFNAVLLFWLGLMVLSNSDRRAWGIWLGGFALGLHPLYIVLPGTLLMTMAFAFVSWRSFAERERYIDHLRPFVTSQHLYEQLLASNVSPQIDIAKPFTTLCADVLGARLAYLTALGSLAPLVGPPLAYPQDKEVDLP